MGKDLSIEDNLAALELFPREWIREVGERIRIPVKPDQCLMAVAWNDAGLSRKQVRKLLGNRSGCPVSYWQLDRMIEKGRQIHARRIEIAS